jgi:hypothetical protein
MYQSRPGSGKLRQCSCDTSSPSCNPGAGTVRWLLFLFAWIIVLCSPAFAQSCTLKVQGSLPRGTFTTQRTVTATADCGAGTGVGINWDDPNDPFSNGTSPLVLNHTFSTAGQPQPLYFVSASGGNATANAYFAFQTEPDPSAAFAGDKPSQVVAPVAVLAPPPPGPPPPIAPITIHFECGTVVDSNGTPNLSASVLDITCNSVPANIPFDSNQIQNVIVEVATSGRASTFGSVRFPTKETYAAWTMAPIVLFLSVRVRRRRAKLGSLLGVCAILGLLLSLTSCGGSFSLPAVTKTTLPGQYQVNVISVPNGAMPDGFVQTTLIVPLTVSPTQ